VEDPAGVARRKPRQQAGESQGPVARAANDTTSSVADSRLAPDVGAVHRGKLRSGKDALAAANSRERCAQPDLTDLVRRAFFERQSVRFCH